MLVAMSMTRSADNGSQYHIIGIDSKFQRANQYLSILMLYCIENYAFPSPHIHLFECLVPGTGLHNMNFFCAFFVPCTRFDLSLFTKKSKHIC